MCRAYYYIEATIIISWCKTTNTYYSDRWLINTTANRESNTWHQFLFIFFIEIGSSVTVFDARSVNLVILQQDVLQNYEISVSQLNHLLSYPLLHRFTFVINFLTLPNLSVIWYFLFYCFFFLLFGLYSIYIQLFWQPIVKFYKL